MIINTNAIVLKTFSYGETSLISRCFTEDRGKISFIIKGAKSKKTLMTPYFQPLSYINIIFNENEKRELQIVSKVSFVKIWTQIPLSLKKMTLAQSILEISDFTLEKNDPYSNLFRILIKTFLYFENEAFDENIIFWHYECKVLFEMGFLNNIEDDQEFFTNEYVRIKKTDTSYLILQSLIKGDLSKIDINKISKKEKKDVSQFLYHKLCYYFEGFEKIKSFQVIKDIYYNG